MGRTRAFLATIAMVAATATLSVRAQPPADDPGLANPPIILEGTRGWQIRFGLTSTQTWTAGDSFGIALVDVDTGARVATCTLDCAGSWRLRSRRRQPTGCDRSSAT